jgi:putative oxidoreductase
MNVLTTHIVLPALHSVHALVGSATDANRPWSHPGAPRIVADRGGPTPCLDLANRPARDGAPATAPGAAALVLRLALGSFWLIDGFFLKGWALGSNDLGLWLASHGLPAALATPLIVAEILGGVLILAGEYGRWASLALLPVLLAAIALPAAEVWALSGPTGALLGPSILIALSMAHGLLGDGPYVLSDVPVARQPSNA